MNEPPVAVDDASDVVLFQVARHDLAPLFEGLLGLRVQDRSPLASAIGAADRDERAEIGDTLNELAGDPTVAKAAAILAAPGLILDERSAGSALPFTFLTACHAPDVDPEAFAVIAPTEDGACVVQQFDSPWSFLASWLDLHASGVEEPTANFIPPPVSYESLVYLFHTIDLFRRKASESQLSYTPADLSLPPDGFATTLKRAAQSRDLRWLLPAFLALMPRSGESEFDEGPEPFEALARLGFLTRSEDGSLAFGEAGRAMGFEFDRSWFQATGFEISVRADGGWETVTRAFLAPTALANHLVLEERSAREPGAVPEPGGPTLNHQAMTLPALESRLARLLDEAIRLCRESGERPSVFCHACGAEFREGARFCASCGAESRSAAT